MEKLIDILEPILPSVITAIVTAIGTGLCTFLVTVYKYNKNIPLDKLEIAYNRVYYPINRAISEVKNRDDIDCFIKKIEIYFVKYKRYINDSTLYLFGDLCNKETKTEKRSAYNNFIENINDQCKYLRKRLGYLTSTTRQIFKYKDWYSKVENGLIIGSAIMAVLVIICACLNKELIIYNIFMTILSIGVCAIVIGLIIYLFVIAHYIKIMVERHKIKKEKTKLKEKV